MTMRTPEQWHIDNGHYLRSGKHHISSGRLKLCNEAREKTEEMVEAMHQRGEGEKPRLDKAKARAGVFEGC